LFLRTLQERGFLEALGRGYILGRKEAGRVQWLRRQDGRTKSCSRWIIINIKGKNGGSICRAEEISPERRAQKKEESRGVEESFFQPMVGEGGGKEISEIKRR